MDERHQQVVALHDEVDRAAAELAARLGPRLRCGQGCRDCCVDDLTVFEVEADRIRRGAAGLLDDGEPGPPGGCAFLDSAGSCRIYEHRPYVCRTQGLPLRWIDEVEPGEVAEFRDICPLNDPGEPPLVELAEADCWTLGPHEASLATLQATHPAGRGARIAIRTLFGGRATR